MTVNEARERAIAIWGAPRLIFVQIRPDGGADVELAASGAPASDTRGRQYCYHRLDAHGHVDCHADCRTLEP